MRLLGNGEPFVSGIDTPEMGKRAKCPVERELAKLARARLKVILKQPGIRVEDSGERDDTPKHRPLVRLRLPDGSIAEQALIDEGYAVVWKPKGHKTPWCS